MAFSQQHPNYLVQVEDIQLCINHLAKNRVLWLDTEVADFKSRSPRLSLIQALEETVEVKGDFSFDELKQKVFVLDVLDKPDLVQEFIDKVMINSNIEKVFHNASYDVRFLGKTKAKNVTCTRQMATKFPYYLLPVDNFQLKTLASHLCNLHLDKDQQTSNWGKRPLDINQIEYVCLDLIALAGVYYYLLELQKQNKLDPNTDDLFALKSRYLNIYQQWKLLDSEISHLEDRLKQAMHAQNCLETEEFKLTSTVKSSKKVAFRYLMELINSEQVDLDYTVTLTQSLQKQLGNLINKLPIEEESSTSWKLSLKILQEGNIDEGE